MYLFISLLYMFRTTQFPPDRHTRQLPTQSETYQMIYWYSWFSWWWAPGCSKHVEKWNTYIEEVRQVGYWQELYRDARSTKNIKTLYIVLKLYRICQGSLTPLGELGGRMWWQIFGAVSGNRSDIYLDDCTSLSFDISSVQL